MRDKSSTLKRHCMVVLAHYPWAETRVQREAEALAAQGYDVDVLCLRGKDAPSGEDYRSVHIYRLPVALKKGSLFTQFLNYIHFFVLAAFKLTILHLRSPYRTVQVHNLPDFLVFCALVPKLAGVPIILDLHDLMPEFYAGRFGQDDQALLGRLIRWQEHLACSFADYVITVSAHWRQSLIARGVPAHKCSVVMNVADESIFHPQHDQSSDMSKDSKFRLIYHGTVVERYGLDMAVRAVYELRHEIPNIHLLIIGWGGQVPILEQMIDEFDLQDWVTLEGPRPAVELPEVIQSANLGIVPYRNDVFTDGLLPTKLMEYAAMGLPSVAARTTAIEMVFGDIKAGFFEPGNLDDLVRCILELYHSKEKMAELVEGSKRFHERYNWTKLGAEYVSLVDRLGT